MTCIWDATLIHRDLSKMENVIYKGHVIYMLMKSPVDDVEYRDNFMYERGLAL
jgi:hypothetical protein